MQIKGKGAELAVGASGLLFAAGIAGNLVADHISIDTESVSQLTNQEQALRRQLHENYPTLEALYSAGQFSVEDAHDVAGAETWVKLRSDLKATDEKLSAEKYPAKLLGTTSTLVWIAGGMAVFATGYNLMLQKELQRQAAMQERSSLLQKVAAHEEFDGEISGLNTSNNTPKIVASPLALAAFGSANAEQGLNIFSRYAETEEAKAVLPWILILARNGEMGRDIIRFINPLFGCKITENEGGYDATDLQQHIEAWLPKAINYALLGSEFVKPEVAQQKDPDGKRFGLQYALRVLDVMLPLDQADPKNPPCRDPNSEFYGRHWIDYVEQAMLRTDGEFDLTDR